MIYHGDSLDVLKIVESESVDLLCTDPPYGYSFMGKAWDKTLPDIGIFKECLRVLKPGAFAFVMSAPRSDVCARMMLMLEDAGFEIGFTPIYWTYASGFPKAMNIGKMVDKRNGREPEQYKELGAYLRNQRGTRPQKELADFFPSKTGRLTGCVANWELGLNVPTLAQWSILKRELKLDDRFDELIEREEAEREVVGKHQAPAKEIYQGGELSRDVDVTIPKTSAAKALDGSYGGFQPKPAVEVVIVAMKPLSEKTYVDQALKNGKGITWLDDCRVPTSEDLSANFKPGGKYAADETIYKLGTKTLDTNQDARGRFPANLLVSDDVLNDGIDRGSKSIPVRKTANSGGTGIVYTTTNDAVGNVVGYGDVGSYSRFFSLDAWAQTLPFLVVPKASRSEKNAGLGDREKATVSDGRAVAADNAFQRGKTERSNTHPTVKPLKLMSYLITLGSRPGDVVLDPFLGSGTTALAAKQLGRQYIGIEREAEYVEIAEARLSALNPTLI